MSYTEIYAFNKDGQAEFYGETKNSHRGAMAVWKYFEDKYLEKTKYPRMILMEPLPDGRDPAFEIWDLVKTDLLSEEEKLIMRSTFDYAVIRNEELPKLIAAYESLIPDSSLAEQAEILKEIYNSEQYIAVAWNQTSVNCAFWSDYYKSRVENRVGENFFEMFFDSLQKTLKLSDEKIEELKDSDNFEDIYENFETYISDDIVSEMDINLNYSLKEKNGEHWFICKSPLLYSTIDDYLNLQKNSDHLKTLFYLFSKVFYSFYKNNESLEAKNYLISLESPSKLKEAIAKIEELKSIDNGEEISENLIELDDYITGQYEEINSLLDIIDEKFFMYRSDNTFEIIFDTD